MRRTDPEDATLKYLLEKIVQKKTHKMQTQQATQMNDTQYLINQIKRIQSTLTLKTEQRPSMARHILIRPETPLEITKTFTKIWKALPEEAQSYIFAIPIVDQSEQIVDQTVMNINKTLPENVSKFKTQQDPKFCVQSWSSAVSNLKAPITEDLDNILTDGDIYKKR